MVIFRISPCFQILNKIKIKKNFPFTYAAIYIQTISVSTYIHDTQIFSLFYISIWQSLFDTL